ncbi:thioredoxin domain-containing protein [Leptospira idonii]|uniref:Protein-disulfide isomerase n=1 Tax=Leptospira idonii TaxID=1193500 RepID=A0A4R9M1Z3_9LEPT|nr:thioredoxin domain-containing protein [Leptospira idonii]TGN20760.1 protein-disulfide isomerase [Leptospira idonii]
MDRKKLNIIGIAASIAGLVLSFLLAVEYFGLGTDNIANSACSAMGGGSSCLKVAESSFSAIPNVPILGDVPIALFGFGFYGVLSFLFFLNLRPSDEESFQTRSLLIVAIAALGFLLDIVLFGISVGIIGTVCQLCAFTYLVTFIIGVTGVLLVKEVKADYQKLKSAIVSTIGTLALVFFFSFSVGYASSKLTASPSSNTLSTSKGMDTSEIEKKVAEYEASPALNIDISGSASIGKKDAPITIVKYADFNCGHCLHTSHILHTVLSEYDGMVKVVYRNFPLDGSCNHFVQQARPGASSCVAAMASICADKQGKFEQMYRGLYDNTEKGVAHSTSTVLNLANTLSLNVNQLKACMSSKEASDQLNKEIEEAGRLNIQATPSLYINDKRIDSGTPNPVFLKTLLDRLIKKI